jgi:uncharacterized RDD family membrane protein YckC
MPPGPPPPPNPYAQPNPYAYPPPAYGYTPYGRPQATFAGFGARLGGFLLDVIIVGIPMGIVSYFLLFRHAGFHCSTVRSDFGNYSSTNCSFGSGFWSGELLLLVVWFVVGGLYNVIPVARGGQTLGMKVARTRVVDGTTGGPIGTGRSFGRFLMKSYISGLVCYLGFLWMLWDDRNQTWHDKAVGSIVVNA